MAQRSGHEGGPCDARKKTRGSAADRLRGGRGLYVIRSSRAMPTMPCFRRRLLLQRPNQSWGCRIIGDSSVSEPRALHRAKSTVLLIAACALAPATTAFESDRNILRMWRPGSLFDLRVQEYARRANAVWRQGQGRRVRASQLGGDSELLKTEAWNRRPRRCRQP